ncbi:uncharacterized protein J4E84_010487 [Alternaria hordeiaustralica]|uniref:uncharacterized protein n=1 Tax=Alternaria hordeiaustralica TaxID=1187925 RepID=UPI0020C4A09C|nr:uncharacterized protein J4E84_010487 [Alternaria hordeiaustralica]KAI4674746.1 hypothetical protein J4E84_010487 [Alternaria hordeiaustralica]
MSRPCQQRRASAAANRKSRGSKPTGPPPIRHKARQKAIHNARRSERGGARGGRGGGRGGGGGGGRGGAGRGGRGGGRGGRFAQKNGRNESGQDFIPLSSGGNNFEALYRSSRNVDFDLDMDGDSSDSDAFGDELLDDDMYEAEDIEINVQAPLPTTGRGRQPRAQIMFTEAAAVAVYRQLYLRDYPLSTSTTRVRYGLYQEDTSADSAAYISLAPSTASRRSSVISISSDTSEESTDGPTTPEYNPARDYVFTFGMHRGERFTDVNENYLRMIGGQLYKYRDKHAGLLEAFEYHRPGQARLQPDQTQTQQTQAQLSQPRQASTRNAQGSRSNALSASDTWTFHKGIHLGKRLHDVPENYLRTLEGNPLVRDAWPGFKQALQDFNAKTGRKGRV